MEPQEKKQKKAHPLVWFILVIFLISAVYLAYWQVISYLPNSEHIPFRQYFDGLNEEQIYIVLGDRLIDNYIPLEKDSVLFLPADFIKNYIDKYIFWDDEADMLIITTDYKVTRFGLSQDIFFEDGMAYISSGLITELYGVGILFGKSDNIVIMDYKELDKDIFTVASKTANLRYEPDKKSPIAAALFAGEEVTAYNEQDGYTFVRTSGGILGYVLTKDIELNRTIKGTEPEQERIYKTPPIAKTGKINILFEQLFNIKQSRNELTRKTYEGLDVLCPTWFSFDESLNGDIIDIADKSYVDWAHENGIYVWGLITDNFDGDVTHFILGDTKKREYVIEQLLNVIAVYGLDGINIDFENVRAADGEYYVQFIRELAPLLKEQGVILSVDMKVPKPYNSHFNYEEVGRSADFIIIMGYDEYWASSPESGPVASIGFVENGIFDTLKEVPKEKIILGVPYYNRVWTETETGDGVKVSSYDDDMTDPYELFIEQGAEFEWDEETCNYYAEYTGVEKGLKFTNKVWLEDERSLEEKLMIVKQYDIAGVAGWKKGLEKETVWDLLNKYLSK